MKRTRKPLWSLGWRIVSKTERRMSPAVPARAKTMESTERVFSSVLRLGARRPRCRSQRSRAKARLKETVVTADPAMKSGLSSRAPMSLMYGSVMPSDTVGRRRSSTVTIHQRSRPSNVPSQTAAEKTGIHCKALSVRKKKGNGDFLELWQAGGEEGDN